MKRIEITDKENDTPVTQAVIHDTSERMHIIQWPEGMGGESCVVVLTKKMVTEILGLLNGDLR